MNEPTTITEYSPVEAGLAEVRSRLQGIVHDVTTADGLAAARKDRRECVTLRTALESKRKELKADILERGRLVDGEAKRILVAIEALEQPIDEQIKAQERKVEEEKAERERLERNRVAEIHGRIDRIVRRPIDAIGLGTAGLDLMIKTMVAAPVEQAIFQEFTKQAVDLYDGSLAKLREMRDLKAKEEAEAARIKAEGEELERQRKAEDDRQAEARRKEAAAELHRVEVARVSEESAQRQREAADAAAKFARDYDDAIAENARRTEDRALEQRRLEVKRDEEAAIERKRKADAEEADRTRAANEAEAERVRKVNEEEAERKRQAAREDAEKWARAAADPVPALRKILALCQSRTDKDDALVRSTVAGIASGTLFQIDELARKAKRTPAKAAA